MILQPTDYIRNMTEKSTHGHFIDRLLITTSLDSQSLNTWIYTSPSSFNFVSIKQAEIYSTAPSSLTYNNQLSIPPGPYFDIPITLTHTLQTTPTLETATDGSVSQGTMTASWALKLN